MTRRWLSPAWTLPPRISPRQTSPSDGRTLATALADEGGGVIIPFVLSLFVLFGVGSLAVDVGRAYSMRSTLQAAADAAVLAAAGYEGNDLTQAEAIGLRVFAENITGKVEGATIDLQVLGTGRARADVRMRAPVSLARTVGIDGFDVAVNAAAGEGRTSELDLHVLVDNSGSMNIPDGAAEIARLHAVFRPYGGVNSCSFACHRDDNINPGTGIYNGQTGFEIARANNIFLREDRIKLEINNLVDALTANANGADLRFGLWNMDSGLTETQPLTDNDAQFKASVQAMSNNSHSSNWDWELPKVVRALPPLGSRQGIVLLISDGLDYRIGSGTTYGFDPTQCDAIKAAGYQLYVLNIKYPDPSLLAGNESKVTETIPFLPLAEAGLRACASPGRYYEADYEGSVTTAFRGIANSLTGAGHLRLTQ